MDEALSKTIDGVTDLVVVAPIKEGFIPAFETTSYEGRLELVAGALDKLRVAARERERLLPFSDVTERILSLLNFRIAIIDENQFSAIAPARRSGPRQLRRTRHLCLTATFEGGFEPYMRQIWWPLGPFLDLLFCNCEGYITATEHSFDEYIQWVRDHRVESAIFYNTTGLTVRDQLYLSNLEAAQRDGLGQSALGLDLALAGLTMPNPEDAAERVRGGRANFGKVAELGFEALTVLFKLADFYPPEWLTGPGPVTGGEGLRLIRATDSILSGFVPFVNNLAALAAGQPQNQPLQELAKAVGARMKTQPWQWFETGRARLKTPPSPAPALPEPDLADVQAGILKAAGTGLPPMRHGALLLFTVRHAPAARTAIAALVNDGLISFAGDAPGALASSIAFTHHGLVNLAMFADTLERFPAEFRQGMAERSSILGDMRELHPRNWILPDRNGPAFLGRGGDALLPPVAMEEVDFIIQLRSSDETDVGLRERAALLAQRLVQGATLEAIEWLHVAADGEGRFVDHFGFLDGLSQPQPAYSGANITRPRDTVALGEVLLGYANDRQDGPPGVFATLDGKGTPTHWRQTPHRRALDFQKNGSFLVVRKIGTDVAGFEAWLAQAGAAVAGQLGIDAVAAGALIKAKLMGREADGTPLVGGGVPKGNDFDFAGDQAGLRCPHAAHMRRANPRRSLAGNAPESRAEFGRPTPRLLRRGMLFGREDGKPKGLMFMAYAASIAEQYEVIQRWLNGGNSTDVASANNDVLTGVQPRLGNGVFRFVHDGQVVRVPLPSVQRHAGGLDEGPHPFAPVYWGLYLFAPSRSALLDMAKWEGIYIPIDEMREEALGEETMSGIDLLGPEEAGKEWKRIMEDFITRDPAQRNISPHVWSALRWQHGGAYKLPGGMPLVAGKAADDVQPVILCADRPQVMQVLAQWQYFSTEEQLRRIKDHAGPIYVAQQPDNLYLDPSIPQLDYHAESAATNAALYDYSEEQAFLDGYAAGREVLTEARKKSVRGRDGPYAKLELRREYLQPAMAVLWRTWYGLPDGDKESLKAGGWDWRQILPTITDAATQRNFANCPGDFLAPSRGTAFPRPSEAVTAYARMHGEAILQAGRDFVAKYRSQPEALKPLVRRLFEACDDTGPGNDVLARNVIGTMIGAIPPMEANMRNILMEWLTEQSLWRHQAALLRALDGKQVIEQAAAAREALRVPISQAICKRPAPDVLFRTVKANTEIKLGRRPPKFSVPPSITANPGDMVVVSLASVSQWSLHQDAAEGAGDVTVVFGGGRGRGYQGYDFEGDTIVPTGTNDKPVHACPAMKMAMGAMTGMLAALLDAGTIQALPAALIVRINQWRWPEPQAG